MHWSKNPKIRQQVLDKISQKLKGRVSPRKGVKLSETTKKKISKSKTGRKIHTEQSKKEIRRRFLKMWADPEFKAKRKEAMRKAFLEGRWMPPQNTGRTRFKKGQTTSKRQKEIAKRNWLGSKNPRWSGGQYKSKTGYTMILTEGGSYRPEHRIVAERIIGRKLRRHEIIHHINEDKSDNRPENLYYFSNDNLHKSYHGLKSKPKLVSNLDENFNYKN